MTTSPAVWSVLIALAALPGGEDSPLGTWHLTAGGARLALTVRAGEAGDAGALEGSIVDEQAADAAPAVDRLSWEPAAKILEFRVASGGGWQWFRGSIVDGVFAGRFTPTSDRPDKPGGLLPYTRHATGWNFQQFEAEGAPLVFEILGNSMYRGRLRIDRPVRGGTSCSGRLKMYSSIRRGAADEEEEHDLEVTRWDGMNLRFVRRGAGWYQDYTGVVTGRTIKGTFTHSGSDGVFPWEGTRAEILSYGFEPRNQEDRTAWQERTRRRLMHLMMAGNPSPETVRVVEGGDGPGSTDRPPLPSAKTLLHRDDDTAAWPQAYRLRELRFESTLPNPYGLESLRRSAHGYLAIPETPPPAGGKYPAVLAVNGHGGSAWQQMDPDSEYFWYGDAFARRGYVVLSLDISHRPVEDRQGLYGGYTRGDDPDHGNGTHPAIRADGFDSDWEEDGERVWDAMRAMDYLVSLPNVDPSRVLVTGLSMGGEVTAFTAALDPRLALSIPAGYSPDMGVMTHHGNHECWRWNHGDIREYIDVADTFALTAPRPLIVQTGKADRIFSAARQPFAGDKQMARRVRAAYGGQSHRFLHYLHYDQHHYHAGDRNPAGSFERGVRLPDLIGPVSPWSTAWQGDGRTIEEPYTLFDYVAFFLNRPGRPD